MKTCPKCGSEQPQSAEFCNKCGYHFEMSAARDSSTAKTNVAMSGPVSGASAKMVPDEASLSYGAWLREGLTHFGRPVAGKDRWYGLVSIAVTSFFTMLTMLIPMIHSAMQAADATGGAKDSVASFFGGNGTQYTQQAESSVSSAAFSSGLNLFIFYLAVCAIMITATWLARRFITGQTEGYLSVLNEYAFRTVPVAALSIVTAVLALLTNSLGWYFVLMLGMVVFFLLAYFKMGLAKPAKEGTSAIMVLLGILVVAIVLIVLGQKVSDALDSSGSMDQG